jgi:hypothetical protein
MKIQYSFLEDDLVEFQQFHMAHSPFVRKQRMLVMAIFTTAIMFLAAIIKSERPEFPGIVPRLVTGGFVSAVFCVILHFAYRRNIGKYIRRLVHEGSTDGVFGSQELELDDLGITRRTIMRMSFAAWPVVRRVEETSDYVLIYVSSIEAYVIRKNRVVDGDLDQLVKAVKEHIDAANIQADE